MEEFIMNTDLDRELKKDEVSVILEKFKDLK